ncbi:glycosyltransferase [Bordetella genomosp. 1]|uniref:Glycosyl transferase n=1 Tax=Bordetella genomosp. 1 TaxID=1395607 RepID=A0ABX4EY90_9BORD|nr:glycosyltransferase family 2 protein [Bordetella genomosp. 1]OZI64057.1 glycosyl transferase [Bordetella genomosp. 1]
MIGVCIPAHNEEAVIDACLASVLRAARHPALGGEPVRIAVVLDACTDATPQRARRHPVARIVTHHRNVGLARAAGARHLIEAGARWLAFTDADTTVAPRWLADQLALQAAVVCGTVGVKDWRCHGANAAAARAAFRAAYQDRDGHRHVHGANLGISRDAYLHIGGFEALACSEDQALVDRLEQAGVAIAWSARPRVTTSARPYSRVDGGFATTLRRAWTDTPLASVEMAHTVAA